MTRIQKERFTNLADYEKVKGNFILTPKLLNQASSEYDDTLDGIVLNWFFYNCLLLNIAS